MSKDLTYESGGILDSIVNNLGEDSKKNSFYEYEPWDIKKKHEPWLIELAREYGVDFESQDLIDRIGKAPRLFQSGYLFSDAFIRVCFASNQSGKTYGVLQEIVMRLSGEIPTSLKYERGEKTGKKRSISENNITRFGRRNKTDGSYIDKNVNAEKTALWDCGEIIGAGIYPKERLHPHGSKVWVVTKKQARDDAWWPTLKGVIPEKLLDTTKGSQDSPGFDNRTHTCFLKHSCVIKILTYEQGYQALEAAGKTQEHEKLVQVIFDEEPPTDRFLNVVIPRVSEISLITTPYEELSWSYDELWVKSLNNPDIEIFHCTAFDCPYKTKEEVMKKMRSHKKWEVAARIFGVHGAQSGRPYYEESYDDIAKHIRGARDSFTKMEIRPTFAWEEPIELAVRRDEMMFIEADTRDSWEVYEDPKPECEYWMSVDTAEGSEDESQEQDRHAAHVLRKPMSNEGSWPIQCATLDAGMEVDQFARLCLYGCAAYNNCLLAPEALGKSAGIFLHETKGWPFRFTFVVTNDITKKQTEKYGFFTSASNRTLLFDLVGSMLKDMREIQMFGLRNIKLLKQIAGTIVGKGGRPDHKKRKRNDCLMSYGIGLWVFKEAYEQIQNNVDAFKAKQPQMADSRFNVEKKRPIALCSGKTTRQPSLY